ncbi:hypothetical protein ACIPR8_19850 [Stenotrophomonas sp. LARHCG68]
MTDHIETLAAVVSLQQQAIDAQAKQIGVLAEQVGLLVQSVAQLLGEEAGIPVEGEGDATERVDLDGRSY